MNDVARDFIWSQQVHGCHGASAALVALDAERAEHDKEIVDLRRELRETNHTNNMVIMDLRQRISALEAQLVKIRGLADTCLRGRTIQSDMEVLHEIVSLIDEEEGHEQELDSRGKDGSGSLPQEG